VVKASAYHTKEEIKSIATVVIVEKIFHRHMIIGMMLGVIDYIGR
jgi:hypothetical protein